MMTQGNPRWVSERARCHPLGLLHALHKRLQRDCRKINEQPHLVRRGYKYAATSDGSDESSRVKVEGVPENPQYNSMGHAVLKPASDHVKVNIWGVREGGFDIHMKWDIEKSRCDLIVNDEKTDLASISERILGRLGFP